MSRYEKIPMIEMADLNDLELLKTHRIYSDEFEKLPEERKLEIYKYCKLHATCPGCLASLEQIRYAVTKLYFGWPEKVDDTDSSSRKQYQRKAHLLRNRLGKIMAVYKNEHDLRTGGEDGLKIERRLAAVHLAGRGQIDEARV